MFSALFRSFYDSATLALSVSWCEVGVLPVALNLQVPGHLTRPLLRRSRDFSCPPVELTRFLLHKLLPLPHVCNTPFRLDEMLSEKGLPIVSFLAFPQKGAENHFPSYVFLARIAAAPFFSSPASSRCSARFVVYYRLQLPAILPGSLELLDISSPKSKQHTLLFHPFPNVEKLPFSHFFATSS